MNESIQMTSEDIRAELLRRMQHINAIKREGLIDVHEAIAMWQQCEAEFKIKV